MEVKIATSIETKTFYSIIAFLKKENWKLKIEYDDKIFDKGIDFDFYQFDKNNETIQLAWSNWFEGEIKAKTTHLNLISNHFNFQLMYGEPEYLCNPKIEEELKMLLKFY